MLHGRGILLHAIAFYGVPARNHAVTIGELNEAAIQAAPHQNIAWLTFASLAVPAVNIGHQWNLSASAWAFLSRAAARVSARVGLGFTSDLMPDLILRSVSAL